MADLEVIFDPAKEVAAIVNIDNRVGWGPAMIGPQAGDILQAFLDSVPFDLSETDSFQARGFFDSFLDAVGAAPAPLEQPGDPVAPQPAGSPSVDAAALAQTEAAAAGDPAPPPAPADADAGAATSSPDQVNAPGGAAQAPAPTAIVETAPTQVSCPNCNGTGTIVHGDDGAAQTCGMCAGNGHVTVSA